MKTRRKFTYADEVWNVAHGCAPVSAGCDNCWAKGMACRQRNASAKRGSWSGEIVTFPEKLSVPLHWRKPRVIAVQFMGDVALLPFEFIAAVFGVMAACPQHTFLLLTKRPERMAEWFDWVKMRAADGLRLFPHDDEEWRTGQLLAVEAGRQGVPITRKPFTWPIPNVWLGISAEDQPALDERWKHLSGIPAAKRWLSLEPLLGPVAIHALYSARNSLDDPPIDWVVVGAESGPRARPCHTEWIQSVVDQCQEADVDVHVKQIQLGADGCDLECCRSRVNSNPEEWPAPLRVRQWPGDS